MKIYEFVFDNIKRQRSGACERFPEMMEKLKFAQDCKCIYTLMKLHDMAEDVNISTEDYFERLDFIFNNLFIN